MLLSAVSCSLAGRALRMGSVHVPSQEERRIFLPTIEEKQEGSPSDISMHMQNRAIGGRQRQKIGLEEQGI